MNRIIGISIIGLMVFLGINTANGQGYWEKTFGGSDSDYGKSVQQTTDGGYIIAGYTSSFGAGSDDVYLVKTDGDGSEQWSKTFGGTSFDRARSVQQTTDGGYIIAGAGSGDVYLIKTDANGNEEWSKTLGGINGDGARSVRQTTDGGFIIAGVTGSFGDFSGDVYLIKTDANGNEEWSNTFGGSNSDFGESVRQTTDGGYIVAGYTHSFSGFGPDVYLVKTDANGNEEWSNTWEWEACFSVRQTTDGGYIIGTWGEYGGIYLVKTDGDGSEQWKKYLGGGLSGDSVQQTTDGGYIVAGHANEYGSEGVDVYLVKTDGNGDIQWRIFFGGSGVDEGSSVQQTTDGGYIVAGRTSSFGAGEVDVYLIYYKPGPVWYVDGEIEASGNGSRWSEAFKTIQEAVDVSVSGNEIWVKQGTYYLDSTIEWAARWPIPIEIYGGFAGTETERDQRNLRNNVTIIDGQNTVRCFLVTADAIIDGFTITNGYTPDGGGGMRIERHSPTIENCTFSGNHAIEFGGAIHNDSSSPIITNCTFSGNDANGGGAIRNRSSSPIITNCTFSENSGGWDGGAIYNYLPSSPIITNCTFSGNDAYEGGAIRNNSSSPTITNCTFLRNDAGSTGGAIDNSSSSPSITNCILWADSPDEISNSDGSDPTVTFSDIEGGYPGEGNIDADPLFHVNYIVDDTVKEIPTYRLRPDSPCIDAGTSENAPDVDIDGDERPWGAGFDIGADEYIPPEVYWTPERMRNAIGCPMPEFDEEAEQNMPEESV